jgi:hypothetical protein
MHRQRHRALAACALLTLARGAAADDTGLAVVPRVTLPEVQYPQGLAASAGLWLRPIRKYGYEAGQVSDVQLGMSGASIAVGIGATAGGHADYEAAWSFGAQWVVHRTWSFHRQWLPEATTFFGPQLFVHYFAFRCFIGGLRHTFAGPTLSTFVTGGCGIGSP